MVLYLASWRSVKLERLLTALGTSGTFALAILILLGHQLFYSHALAWDGVDDAYISFRYGQNLLAGHGLVFNAGEKVEGYTNFLWTLLVAPFMGVGLPPGPVAIVLGALSALGTLVVAFLLMRRLMPEGGALATVPGLLLAVDGSFSLWSVSGLETAAFTFLVTLGALAYLWEWEDEESFPWSGVLFALAALTRPEGVMVFLVAVGHRIMWRLGEERGAVSWQDLARLALFGTLYGLYFLWRYQYYGYLLPNTFYAKVATGGIGAQLARGGRHLGRFLHLHLGYPFLLLPALALARRGTLFATSFLWSLVGSFVLYIIYVGGDWSVGRFFVPILPAFYLLVAVGLGNILALWGRGWQRWGGVRRLAGWGITGMLIAVLFLTSSLLGEYRLYIGQFNARLATQARVALGRWLGANLPSGTLIAVDAAGQLPYYSGLPAIDIFGINDLHIAHMKVKKMGQGIPGHEKLDLAYVVSRRPAYVIIYGDMMEGVSAYERVELPWTDEPRLRRFLNIYHRTE